MPGTVKVSVSYYSSTGTIAELARSIAGHAEKAGAEVRLRKVKELAPQSAIDANEDWKRNAEQTADIAEAEADDVVSPGYTQESKFADGNPYGTSHVSGHGDVDDTAHTAAAVEAERVVKIAARLAG